MTKEQVEDEFYALTEKMMQYLKNNHHPHTRIFITSDNAELVEGVMNNHRSSLADERKEAFNKIMEETEMKTRCEDKKEDNQADVTNWIKSEFGEIPPDEMYSKNVKTKTTSS